MVSIYETKVLFIVVLTSVFSLSGLIIISADLLRLVVSMSFSTFVIQNRVVQHIFMDATNCLSKDEAIVHISALWSILTVEERAAFAECLVVRAFKKNEPIYREGESPDDLICLLTGKVKIYRDGVGGRSQIIRVIKPVEYFGYRAYLANEPYVTAAAAFEPSEMCFIPMPLVEKTMQENNALAMFFVRQLAIDLGVSDKRTVNLTQKHIRGRLAESLLFLKDCYGLEEDKSTLSIYLSREDLASLSNMTTSNAIRTLSNFAAEKIIAIDGKKIKLIDEDKLNQISRIG